MRSAFGLRGQKCSACSRVYVERPVYEKLTAKLVELTEKLTVGDPAERSVYVGPVINHTAYQDFQKHIAELSRAGRLLTGGRVLADGMHAKGYFCAPMVVTDVPLHHPLWKHEMFLPITMVAAVDSLEEAMKLANDVNYGLTAGFYGSKEEVRWFFAHIQALVE